MGLFLCLTSLLTHYHILQVTCQQYILYLLGFFSLNRPYQYILTYGDAQKCATWTRTNSWWAPPHLAIDHLVHFGSMLVETSPAITVFRGTLTKLRKTLDPQMTQAPENSSYSQLTLHMVSAICYKSSWGGGESFEGYETAEKGRKAACEFLSRYWAFGMVAEGG